MVETMVGMTLWREKGLSGMKRNKPIGSTAAVQNGPQMEPTACYLVREGQRVTIQFSKNPWMVL